MVDLSVSPRLRDLIAATKDFVRDEVIPLEIECNGNVHDGPEDLRQRLQDAARRAGVFGPTVPADLGGLGLDRREQSYVLEAAGYSLLGPLALNCAAPDEGNMHLLGEVADPVQQDRYLRPLASGAVRSCFAMTEPAPGAGSDPTLLQTTAAKVGEGWVLRGHKWFITGAIGAGFTICMARTSGDPGDRGGATLFLVDADNPGLHVERNIPTLDQSLFGGHAELRFEDCVVTDEAVLGEVGHGFAHAQVRLAPARLTHCMRWLGVAQRAQDIALERAATRRAFGHPLSELGMAQLLLADSEIDLTAARALIRETAWILDMEMPAGQMSSISKTFVAEAVGRIVDRSLQLCGALGVSDDILLSRFMREVRPFRIYDGPSETHRWSIARRAVTELLAASRP